MLGRNHRGIRPIHRPEYNGISKSLAFGGAQFISNATFCATFSSGSTAK
jgi:hypothetical protein